MLSGNARTLKLIESRDARGSVHEKIESRTPLIERSKVRLNLMILKSNVYAKWGKHIRFLIEASVVEQEDSSRVVVLLDRLVQQTTTVAALLKHIGTR